MDSKQERNVNTTAVFGVSKPKTTHDLTPHRVYTLHVATLLIYIVLATWILTSIRCSRLYRAERLTVALLFISVLAFVPVLRRGSFGRKSANYGT